MSGRVGALEYRSRISLRGADAIGEPVEASEAAYALLDSSDDGAGIALLLVHKFDHARSAQTFNCVHKLQALESVRVV